MKDWGSPQTKLAPFEDEYVQPELFLWKGYKESLPRSKKRKAVKTPEFKQNELPFEYDEFTKQSELVKYIDPNSGAEIDIEKLRIKSFLEGKGYGIGMKTSPSKCEKDIRGNLYGDIPAYKIGIIKEPKIEEESKAIVLGRLYHKLAQVITVYYLRRNFYKNEKHIPKFLVEMLIGPVDESEYKRKSMSLEQEVYTSSSSSEDRFDEIFRELYDAIDLNWIKQTLLVNYDELEEDILQFCLKIFREWKLQIRLMKNELNMSDETFVEVFKELNQNIPEQLKILNSVLKTLDKSLQDINPEAVVNIVSEQEVISQYIFNQPDDGFYYKKLNRLEHVRTLSNVRFDLIVIYESPTASLDYYDSIKLNAKIIDYKTKLSNEHKNPDTASLVGRIQYILGAQALIESTRGSKYKGFVITRIKPYELDLSGIEFYYADLKSGELLNATPHAHQLKDFIDMFSIYVQTAIMFKKTFSNIIAES